MTLPEVMLWQRLRGSPMGVKFRRQHSIDPYVADFYCSACRLVVEIDGQAHDNAEVAARDAKRCEWLASKGYRVERIAAVDVLRDVDEVAQSLVTLALSLMPHQAPPPLRQASPATSPQAGRNDPPRHGEVARSAGGGVAQPPTSTDPSPAASKG